MIYVARDSNGALTGAQYSVNTPAIRAHHAAFGETISPALALHNIGEEDQPEWEVVEASIDDLRAEMVVSRLQARAVLRQAGLLDRVDGMIANSGNGLMIDAWTAAIEFRRLSPMIIAMGEAMELDADDLDALFIAAADISM